MLSGERVTLRPVRPEDYPRFYEWRIDLATWSDTTEEPPYPMTYETYVQGWEDGRSTPEKAPFAVDVAGELVGRAGLFAFDGLARNAEVGLAFGPEHRGKGYGREVLGVLLEYAFMHRNLHRVWLECTARNEAAIRAYAAAGFVEEGRLREHAWVDGRYVDMVRMAVLRTEWESRR
jgi:RimJ/RimL family protein N-acetyltransferase